MSSFTFYNNIPAAANNPSVDQPKMLVNNQSENSIWDVDHVGFNTSGGGRHTQVTFNSNEVPVPPTSPPVLFSNDVNAIPQLFWYSGSAAQSADQYDQAANFSTFLLGGLILKGGTISLTANPQTITYSALAPAIAPFINNTLAVILYPANSTAASRTPYISAQNATTFTVTNGWIAATATYNFIAIGY